MANLIVPYSDQKLRNPSLLKDFLLDDLSSCSSNGFRSFPRRQCCNTNVRFLLDFDLAKKKQIPVHRSRSKPSSPVKSAFQKASTALINAVKRVTFASTKPRRAILPRSFSRKFLKRSFWKKSDRKEIEKWNSFHTVVDNASEPSAFSPVKSTAITDADSGNSENKSYGSNSWSDSEFTSSSSCSSGNSGTVNSSENDAVVESKKKFSTDDEVATVGEIIGVIVGEATTITAANCTVDSPKKQWPNEEKEHSSPVSVLDCPFYSDDVVEEEEEVSSPFKHRISLVEGTKLRQNLRRLKSLSKLEPVDLQKRIAIADYDQEPVGSPSLSFIQETNTSEDDEEDDITGDKAIYLLEQMKAETISMSLNFNIENIFLDFFEEATTYDDNVSNCKLIDVARNWMNGQAEDMLLGWEVQRNREAYIKEMEKEGIWEKLDEDKDEVAAALEAEIFTDLVNDLFLIS